MALPECFFQAAMQETKNLCIFNDFFDIFLFIFPSETVDRHFRWMEEHGIDGVFLQRFVSELSDPNLLRARDTVADLVRISAEKHQRVFAIMYDVSGASTDTVCSGRFPLTNAPILYSHTIR